MPTTPAGISASPLSHTQNQNTISQPSRMAFAPNRFSSRLAQYSRPMIQPDMNQKIQLQNVDVMKRVGAKVVNDLTDEMNNNYHAVSCKPFRTGIEQRLSDKEKNQLFQSIYLYTRSATPIFHVINAATIGHPNMNSYLKSVYPSFNPGSPDNELIEVILRRNYYFLETSKVPEPEWLPMLQHLFIYSKSISRTLLELITLLNVQPNLLVAHGVNTSFESRSNRDGVDPRQYLNACLDGQTLDYHTHLSTTIEPYTAGTFTTAGNDNFLDRVSAQSVDCMLDLSKPDPAVHALFKQTIYSKNMEWKPVIYVFLRTGQVPGLLIDDEMIEKEYRHFGKNHTQLPDASFKSVLQTLEINPEREEFPATEEGESELLLNPTSIVPDKLIAMDKFSTFFIIGHAIPFR